MGIVRFFQGIVRFLFSFFIFAIAVDTHCIAAYQNLFTQESYNELREVALSIEKSFPTSKYVYVGVGRSPTPIIRFFQEIATGLAYNLPLKLSSTEADKTQRAILNKHLDQFLPNSKIVGDRAILLIDFADTGASLIEATQLIRKYLPRKIDLHAVALSNPGRANELKLRVKRLPITVINLAPYPQLTDLFLLSRFDAVSEYDSFPLESHPGATKSKDLHPRPAYNTFGEELLEYMLNDHIILEPAIKIRTCRDKLTIEHPPKLK